MSQRSFLSFEEVNRPFVFLKGRKHLPRLVKMERNKWFLYCWSAFHDNWINRKPISYGTAEELRKKALSEEAAKLLHVFEGVDITWL